MKDLSKALCTDERVSHCSCISKANFSDSILLLNATSVTVVYSASEISYTCRNGL